MSNESNVVPFSAIRCSKESPTIIIVSGAEVMLGWCPVHKTVEATVTVGGKKVEEENLNPLVAAAVQGMRLYLLSQRTAAGA